VTSRTTPTPPITSPPRPRAASNGDRRTARAVGGRPRSSSDDGGPRPRERRGRKSGLLDLHEVGEASNAFFPSTCAAGPGVALHRRVPERVAALRSNARRPSTLALDDGFGERRRGEPRGGDACYARSLGSFVGLFVGPTPRRLRVRYSPRHGALPPSPLLRLSRRRSSPVLRDRARPALPPASATYPTPTVRFVSDSSRAAPVRESPPGGNLHGVVAGGGGVAVRVLAPKDVGLRVHPGARRSRRSSRAAQQALGPSAGFGALVARPVVFPLRAGATGSYESTVAIDRSRSPSQRSRAARRPGAERCSERKPIRSAEAWMDWTRQEKRLKTTEGTDVRQTLTFGARGMQADRGRGRRLAQRRTYPTWQGEGFQGGYERVRALDSCQRRPLADEAKALLSRSVPRRSARRDPRFEPDGLQSRSCGHPTELDRAMGSEISLAGGRSPARAPRQARYGSRVVDLVADSTSEGSKQGHGTSGGPTRDPRGGKRHLVREGLSSTTSPAARRPPPRTGVDGDDARDGWNRAALIRW